MWKQDLEDIGVETCTLCDLLTTTVTLNKVTFNEDLNMNFTKQNEYPELLPQLTFEVINSNTSHDLVLYTEGSRSDFGRMGNGVLMKMSTGEHRYCFRNPYHSSVFFSELVAIREAVNLVLEAEVDVVWILTGSKSSIKYLKNWPNILHMLEKHFILKLAALIRRITVSLQ
ncbi:putative RNA-directed DNA polymerase from transposon BS [Nephila pilipes]|uniref:Putative RNA-directed DNA polymerase from transposon BS n=1 Tax=Nephila pilipes TaxID=299642 RepID=A0A8X6UBN8_NEPPI|nr:putative RNA-directed DNA polymerase from transposon BS [Nephila pilipes]